jgi:aspartate racemase
MRVIGVLGGMGPAATLDFMAKVYAADPGDVEQGRVRLIVDCNPAVDDRNLAVGGEGPSPGPALADMARGLAAAGAQALVIACNTAHAWADEVGEAGGIPLLSMIEAACDAVAAQAPSATRIGLLAGQGCLDAGVYQRAFAARGWSVAIPGVQNQAAFMAALYRIKAGVMGEAERAAFLACAREVMDAGAQVVVAGCTEIPLLLKPGDLDVPLIDPTEALARAAVAFAHAGA